MWDSSVFLMPVVVSRTETLHSALALSDGLSCTALRRQSTGCGETEVSWSGLSWCREDKQWYILKKTSILVKLDVSHCSHIKPEHKQDCSQSTSLTKVLCVTCHGKERKFH